MEKQAQAIEKDRYNTFGVSDTVFDKYLKVKWIIGLVVEDLAKLLLKSKIPVQQIFSNKIEFESLIENMPALNVFAA